MKHKLLHQRAQIIKVFLQEQDYLENFIDIHNYRVFHESFYACQVYFIVLQNIGIES